MWVAMVGSFYVDIMCVRTYLPSRQLCAYARYSRYRENMTNPPESLGTEAWELILRTHAALVPELGRRVEEATGLPLSWYDVLLELNRASERQLRMTDLGERVVLSRTRVSRVVGQMAEAGLVEQHPHPDDGRATLATLTPRGRAALRRAAPTYLASIDAVFSSRMTEAETRTIVSALRRVLELPGTQIRGRAREG